MATSENSMTMNDSPAEVAYRILQESPYREIRSLTCSFDRRVLTISGELPSFHLRQVAQTAVQRIDGVERVDIQIEVSG